MKEEKWITLSPEDIARLQELEDDIEHARFELERAKKVGIDVSELEEMLERADRLRRNLIEEYSPKE